MAASKSKEKSSSGRLGLLLRHWRDARGKSQLDLSLDAGVSQRHISFIESGRSVPGRQLLLDLAQALDVPLRERNALLLAAGYAPVYSEAAWNSDEMRSVTKALERMLRQHDPYPAIVMDRYWNVLTANDSAPRFFNCFIDMAARKTPRNILHLMFDPAGMRPFIANWAQLAPGLLRRVAREAVGGVMDEATSELVNALMAYEDVAPAWRPPNGHAQSTDTLPVLPLSFVKDGVVLNYFSMVSTVGTPQTIAAQELRVECMFPADEATERHHARLMDAAG
jgi:transcriptional regulator with XRE-family HTH domain